MHNTILQIALDTPLDTTFDYRYLASTENSTQPQVGQFVRVPFGKREVAGLIVGVNKTSDIDPQKIRDVIGPGGKMINKIIAETGVSIDIEDDGRVFVTSNDAAGMEKGVQWVKDLTREVGAG